MNCSMNASQRINIQRLLWLGDADGMDTDDLNDQKMTHGVIELLNRLAQTTFRLHLYIEILAQNCFCSGSRIFVKELYEKPA